LSIIIVLVILAGLFDYPDPWNWAADGASNFLKNQQKVGWLKNFKIPHFPSRQFKLGLDLQGGTHLVYEADLSKVEKSSHSTSIQGLRDVIERRINLFGVQEPVVQVQQKGDSYRLIVELAGVKDVGQAIKMIGETPFLEFKEERPAAERDKILAIQQKFTDAQKKGEEANLTDEETKLLLEDPYFVSTNLTGQYLKKAATEFDPQTYKPEVSLEFNDDGAKIFQDITKRNVGKRVAIYVDYNLLSAPTVQEEIPSGKARITGNFTLEEAKSLARNLTAGALPVPIKLISQQTVEASLGRVALEKSLMAGLISFLLIAIFMILFYRFPGFLSIVALGIYAIFVLAIFKLISATLTLSGIAGFVLSVGMAIDANILIFARMKEETRLGKNLLLIVQDGFKRAWPSIRDGNYTTLLTCLILFWLGTGFVKGFALTLILGLISSLFTAMIVSKLLMFCFIETKIGKWKFLWR